MPESVEHKTRRETLSARHAEEKARRKSGATKRIPGSLSRTKLGVLADELKERVLMALAHTDSFENGLDGKLSLEDARKAVSETFDQYLWIWPHQDVCQIHGEGTCCTDGE